MKNLKQFVRETIRQQLFEQSSNELILYHGTPNSELKISNNDIWLTDDVEYAKIWGNNIFEVKIKLNKILDTYDDLGKRKLTLRQITKYLKKKGINTKDFEYVLDKNMFDNEKYIFWQLISKHLSIPYGWLTMDIFHAGYDAITVFEYGYSTRVKAKTFLVNEPENKILSVKKI